MGALAGFDCSEPMGALAGFESPTAASGKMGDGLASIPLSTLDADAAKGLSGHAVACLPVASEPMGALAGFGTQAAARMYFATVSRSMSNSRAMRRFRHPLWCKVKIA
jgi:hypothetical protein